jgi:hypothetical protein
MAGIPRLEDVTLPKPAAASREGSDPDADLELVREVRELDAARARAERDALEARQRSRRKLAASLRRATGWLCTGALCYNGLTALGAFAVGTAARPGFSVAYFCAFHPVAQRVPLFHRPSVNPIG